MLDKVATALQVPIEELTGAPRSSGRMYERAAMRARKQGDGVVQQLLPDPIPGMVIERMEIPARGRIPGVPHMPGTREYFTCEAGEVELAAGGERWRVRPGDVLVFPGDQRHSYKNAGDRAAVTMICDAIQRMSQAHERKWPGYRWTHKQGNQLRWCGKVAGKDNRTVASEGAPASP